ncbi:hypothetical protein V8G54_005541 [Vigna mungo]|uniref:Reverse transcriptase Ty1/copia-type domain-containing protein n=1 Tax=Vigna mungo TaxID=3915 RepID=A0AAQ3S3U4_VIGMU
MPLFQRLKGVSMRFELSPSAIPDFKKDIGVSPSGQDVSILQQVLPIAMAESNSSTVSVIPSVDHHPLAPVSPHTEIIPHRAPMDSPPPQDNGESPTSDSSPSSPPPTPPVSSVVIPKNVKEALDHPGWQQVMIVEMQTFDHSNTWELVPLPPGKKAVGCRWVYVVKVGPDGEIDWLKARLVAKGYTQVYALDYCDTFSPVAKMTTIRLFFAMAAFRHWPLHQLDINNAFLHGDLEEEVYMEQPPGFVAQGESGMVCKLHRSLYGLQQSPRAWFGKFSSIVQKFGLKCSEADHSVFYRHSSLGKCVYLIVYVDYIVITGNDVVGVSQLKDFLCRHFQTKDLGNLKYFLGI